jgi:beta-lactamase regulating signal transducer with metallopeptidase domain
VQGLLLSSRKSRRKSDIEFNSINKCCLINYLYIYLIFSTVIMDLLSRINKAYSSSGSDSESDENDEGNILAKIQPKEMIKSSVPLIKNSNQD